MHAYLARGEGPCCEVEKGKISSTPKSRGKQLHAVEASVKPCRCQSWLCAGPSGDIREPGDDAFTLAGLRATVDVIAHRDKAVQGWLPGCRNRPLSEPVPLHCGELHSAQPRTPAPCIPPSRLHLNPPPWKQGYLPPAVPANWPTQLASRVPEEGFPAPSITASP